MELQSREIGLVQLESDVQGCRYPRVLISERSVSVVFSRDDNGDGLGCECAAQGVR